MKYVSTRGGSPNVSFLETVMTGLAPDGGLYWPSRIPELDWKPLVGKSYHEVAVTIMSLFAPEIPVEDWEEMVESAYGAGTFDSEATSTANPIPIKNLGEGQYVAELFHGPSLAFKDFGMLSLAQKMKYAISRSDCGQVTIIGATSGDTGHAAMMAFADVPGVRVVMLMPKTGMSPFQLAAMTTNLAANVTAVVVDGDFDDCQRMVKEVNGDAVFKKKHRVTAVNSINFGRILAQVVYQVFIALRMHEKAGVAADFAIPSGNFGNTLSAWIARKMGAPVGRLIVCTNENDVLHKFYTKGTYQVSKVQMTSSPSMNISAASNWERWLLEYYQGDPSALASSMQCIERGEMFSVDVCPDWGIASASCSHDRRIHLINVLSEAKHSYLIDPHTADGLNGALEHKKEGVPVVTLATAHPCKFEQTMAEAGIPQVIRPTRFDDIESVKQTYVPMQPLAGHLMTLVDSL